MNSSLPLKFLKSLLRCLVQNFLFIIVFAHTTIVPLKALQLGFMKFLLSLHVVRLSNLVLAVLLPIFLGTIYIMHQQRSVYLVDYSCFRHSFDCRLPIATVVEHIHHTPCFSDRSVRFMTRMLERSGFGDQTCAPLAYHYLPPDPTFKDGCEEAEQVIFSSIDDLFAKTCIKPEEINILITNCSIFNPTPSFVDMIVNKYKLRGDIHNIHISGMGCSSGLTAVEIARNILLAAPMGAHALVVSTEIVSIKYYTGENHAMQLPTILFRMAAAALLLSTSKSKSRFKLRNIVRTLNAAQDNAYRCVFQEEDIEGETALNISKDVVVVAGDTLQANISKVGMLTLPFLEQIKFGLTLLARNLLNKNIKPYVPDFHLAFKHFCIHAGGRAVIDAIQRNLGLADEDVQPSRMTLHRFGNISSSSVWYELAYLDAKSQMMKGDRVWMIGFGPGFECNSVVWECMKSTEKNDGPWSDCIHRYPIGNTKVAQ